ncbi:phosphotransferase family protein [Alicyclobacillus fodiniaquatilis]|jgi:aminoglycoside phosphotransferase (APT) family kinase protein|uniref:Phosphotransferase family protein n=1 Tax=Alicyclobacillus fodiniaquatilis TaxID=1661150 RepID=A0ABW4JKU3_9BACL
MQKDMGRTEDPVLSEEVVLRLVHKHVPGAREVKQVDETGNKARTYLVDEDLVLKTQRLTRINPQTSLEKEVYFLNQIRADDRIRVPRVLGYGTDKGVEYTVMTRMPGRAWRWLHLEGADRRRVLHDLGQMLRYIHQLDQKPFQESQFFAGDLNQSDVRGSIEQSFAALVERLGSRPPGWTLTITPEQVALKVLDSCPPTVEAVALHANPGSPHTFVDEERMALAGLIDFGDAYIGHPAFDLAPWADPQDQQMVFQGYTSVAPVNEAFIAVLRSVTILHILRRRIRNGDVSFNEDLRNLLSQI